MTSRSGPLSDEYILDHCQRYRPIPLGAAQYILMKDLKPQHEHAFGNKPLKYHTQMARPKDFDTLAKAITKMSGNPMVRDELNSAYSKDLQSISQSISQSLSHHVAVPTPPNFEMPEAFSPLRNRHATPKADDEPYVGDTDFPAPDRRARRTIDQINREEVLSDPAQAAMVLHSPGRYVLRDRAVQSAHAAQEAMRRIRDQMSPRRAQVTPTQEPPEDEVEALQIV